MKLFAIAAGAILALSTFSASTASAQPPVLAGIGIYVGPGGVQVYPTNPYYNYPRYYPNYGYPRYYPNYNYPRYPQYYPNYNYPRYPQYYPPYPNPYRRW
jgi:hypothetical protein